MYFTYLIIGTALFLVSSWAHFLFNKKWLGWLSQTTMTLWVIGLVWLFRDFAETVFNQISTMAAYLFMVLNGAFR